jgi:hypothetical protein
VEVTQAVPQLLAEACYLACLEGDEEKHWRTRIWLVPAPLRALLGVPAETAFPFGEPSPSQPACPEQLRLLPPAPG